MGDCGWNCLRTVTNLGLWMELPEGSGQWRTATLAVLHLRFFYHQASLVLL